MWPRVINMTGAALILTVTGAYIGEHTNRINLGLWDHWRVLYAAERINTKSKEHFQEKMALNASALASAPSPWLLQQRVELLALNKESTEMECSRMKVLFNRDCIIPESAKPTFKYSVKPKQYKSKEKQHAGK